MRATPARAAAAPTVFFLLMVSPAIAQEDRAAGLFTEARRLPLVSQSLSVRARSEDATIVLTQVFANPGEAIGQADYRLVLPRDASLLSFRFWQGDRPLEAKLKEREQARTAHAAAAAEGRATAIVQQEGSIYAFSVYPVAAGALQRIEATILMPVEREQARSHLRLPFAPFLGEAGANSLVLARIDTDRTLTAFGVEGEDPKSLQRSERMARFALSTSRALDVWWTEDAPALAITGSMVPLETGFGVEIDVALNDASAWRPAPHDVHLLLDASYSMRRRAGSLVRIVDRARRLARGRVHVHLVGETLTTLDDAVSGKDVASAVLEGRAGHGASWSGFASAIEASGCGQAGVRCLAITDLQVGGLRTALDSTTPVLFLADADEAAFFSVKLHSEAFVYLTESEPRARLESLFDGLVRPVFTLSHLEQDGRPMAVASARNLRVPEGGFARVLSTTSSKSPVRVVGTIEGAEIEQTLVFSQPLDPERERAVRREVYRRELVSMMAAWAREHSDALKEKIVQISLREGIPTMFTALQVDEPALDAEGSTGGDPPTPATSTEADERAANEARALSKDAAIVERVMVKTKAIDIDEGGTNKSSFSDTMIDDLPVAGRSYQNVLSLAPGVQDADGDGNPNVLGGRDRDFQANLDGVSNVDPLTGHFLSNVNPDAIEDLEIVTSGASAEYGGATAGFAKIITKQGSNEFAGTASFYLRHSFFDGNTIATGTDGEKVAYHDVSPSLIFTGPVVRDRLFFALSHEYNDSGAPQSLVGSGSVVVVSKGSRNLDKLTWQLGTRHKMTFQASSDPLRIGPLGVDGLTEPDSGYNYKQGGPTYQVHWDFQGSSVLFLQTLFGYSHTSVSAIPVTRGVKNFCGVDELGAIGRRLDPFGNPGGEPIDEDYCFERRTSRRSGSYRREYSDDRARYTLKSDANWFLDRFLGVSHTLKGGILAQKSRFAADDSQRAFSIFDETLARFRGFDSPLEPGGGELLRTVSVPGQPQVAHKIAHGSDFAAYVEDQFRPHPNVSVRAGLRVQHESLEADGFEHFDPAEEARRFQRAYDACATDPRNADRCARINFHYFHTYELFPVAGTSPIRSVIEDPTVGVQRRTPETFRITNTNVAPRLSLSWDPGTNGRGKLFGTAGRYYGDTFLAVPLYEQPPDTFAFKYLVTPDQRCTNDPNGAGTRCIRVPTIDGDHDAKVSPASIRQVDRNLKTAYQDEYTIGFQRELFQETSITVTAIRRSYRNLFQDVDVNHFARDLGNTETQGCRQASPGGPLVPVDGHPDGVFDDCGGRTVVLPRIPPFFTPRSAELPDGIPDLYIHNPFFNEINRVGNYNVENFKALQVELARRLHRGWQLQASYVWSKATGNAEDYNQALGNDPTTVQDEFGYLSYDQRHVVKVNVTTQLPLWNVRLSSAFTWQTGLPYSIVEVRDSNDQPRFFGNFRIAYEQARTTFPTHQRNDQRNSAFWNFDLAARKDFTIGATTLEASLDVFNVFNDDALQIQEVRSDRVVATRHTGRQFQLGARLTF